MCVGNEKAGLACRLLMVKNRLCRFWSRFRRSRKFQAYMLRTRVAESEWQGVGVFYVWSRSRIRKNTRSRCRNRIFCPTSTPGVQLNNFLHHTLKLGIPVEMVQFFWN